MNDFLFNSWVFGISISILGYQLGLFLKKKFKSPLFNPLLISILAIMLFLVVFHVDYDSYYSGAKYLGYLLTPATICLAIPLYQQLDLLKKNCKAILIGITAGVFASLGSVYLLSRLFSFNHQQYVTLLPKSITTAIGIGISEELGGLVTVSVVAIIITGILGNIAAEKICSIFHIHEPIAKGLALGTSAHALGTAKAMEMGKIEGAMSSLTIGMAGLFTVIMVSLFSHLM
jgi:predicted murein hydrolase (TIGR00659 family)